MKYTYQDYQNGACELEDVGQDIPERAPDEALNMASLVQSALSAAGGRAAFEAEFRKNPGALYQAVLKMGVAQAAKHETPPPPLLGELTDNDIQSLDSVTLKRILLAHAGITKRSELP